jgi:hypothetical protein
LRKIAYGAAIAGDADIFAELEARKILSDIFSL